MLDDTQFLYDEDRIETMMFGDYDSFIDFIYSYEYERDRIRYIDDTIKEMCCWGCFEQIEGEKRKIRTQMEKLNKPIDKERESIKHEIEKPKKIGRNDPCPCGSGKKYKKCCLNKEASIELETKKEHLESVEEQKKWLEDYPKEEGERKDGEIRITDIYDRESIDIDKSVYLALHHRAIPMWVKRDRHKEEMITISYLIEAYGKFASKCENEGISSFDEYDNKYKIHYKSKEWIEILKELINKNELESKHEDVLKKINETISRFS